MSATGAGQPVLLLHGWGSSGAIWQTAAGDLAADYRVFTPDLPGHGDRPPPAAPETFTLAACAEDLAAVIEGAIPEPPVAVGWSLGGLVLLELLKRRPGILRGAVFVSATPKFLADDDFPDGMNPAALRLLRTALKRNFPAGLAKFRELLLSPGERASPLGPLLQSGALGPLPAPETALALLDELARSDCREVLPGLRLPVLVVHGEQDAVCPVAAGRALAAGVPGARLCLLPDTGHLPFVTRRPAFLAALRSFLTECFAPPAARIQETEGPTDS